MGTGLGHENQRQGLSGVRRTSNIVREIETQRTRERTEKREKCSELGGIRRKVGAEVDEARRAQRRFEARLAPNLAPTLGHSNNPCPSSSRSANPDHGERPGDRPRLSTRGDSDLLLHVCIGDI